MVLLLLALGATGAAVTAIVHLRHATASHERIARDSALIGSRAARLLELRADLGGAADGPRDGRNLVSFLESSAMLTGIPRQALRISADAPVPVEGRADLLRQTTRVELTGASVRAITKFLGLVEEGFPNLDIRELRITSVPSGQGWTASARLTMTRSSLPASPDR